MNKIEYAKTDPVNKRATFGTRYPQTDLIFNKTDKKDSFKSKTESRDGNPNKRFVSGMRMGFDLDNSTFRKIIFEESAFHNKHGETTAKVSLVSFEDCDFKHTFFGGTNYKRTVFRRCTFERCDFMNSEFEECAFINCHFLDCTAYKVIFRMTEINVQSFHSSINVPNYNFSSLNEEQRKAIDRDWIDVKVALCRQLLATSTDIYHTEYIDKSIFLLKKAEVDLEVDKLLNVREYFKNEHGITPSLRRRIVLITKLAGSIIVKYGNLFLTRGGTSLSRLMLIGLVMVLLISYHLTKLQVTYGSSTSLVLIDDERWLNGLWSNVPYATSLFLNFGFTGFNFTAVNIYVGVIYAGLGLVWYALLIQIIVRKFYR